MGSIITKLFAVLFSIMLVFSVTFEDKEKTSSQLQNEKEKIQNEINASQQKINKLKAEKSQQEEYVAALQGKISLLQDKLDNLESQRDSLQAEIDAIQEKIEKTAADIEETQNKIDEKKAEIKEIYDLYCQRLRAMYISGNVTTLEVILDSGWDMSSILTRAEMVKSVSAQDNATLEELMNKMQEIEKERQALAQKKIELDEDKKTLDVQKAEESIPVDFIQKVMRVVL